MTSIPGVHVETIHNPIRYTTAQIDKAVGIAHLLHRGKFVLTEDPKR
jgi:hypothetical protein